MLGFAHRHTHRTVIRFVSISAKFGICTVVDLNGTLVEATLLRHNTENSKQIFLEKELWGPTPHFHIHVSESVLYIPTIGLPLLQYVDRSWEFKNRSQTYECGNWD